MRELAALLVVDRARARFGLTASKPSLHMSFTGGPGTGPSDDRRAADGDEAYYLFRPENARDYGQEAIELLLQETESERGSLVVIFAGYQDRMETFFSSNPGLSSRVAHHIQVEDHDHARARLRQANQLVAAATAVSRDDLMLLNGADIRAPLAAAPVGVCLTDQCCLPSTPTTGRSVRRVACWPVPTFRRPAGPSRWSNRRRAGR